MKYPHWLSSLVVVLMACNTVPVATPAQTPQAPAGSAAPVEDGPRVLGEVEFDPGASGGAVVRFRPVGGGLRTQTLVGGIAFSNPVSSLTDFPSSANADLDKTRFVSTSFTVTNNNAFPLRNLTLYALSRPSSLNGSMFSFLRNSSRSNVTAWTIGPNQSAGAGEILPAHTVDAQGQIIPDRADMQVFLNAEAGRVQAAARAQGLIGTDDFVLEYGFVARNGSGGRAIAAGGNGRISLTFRLPLGRPISFTPTSLGLRFLLVDEPYVRVSRDLATRDSSEALNGRLQTLSNAGAGQDAGGLEAMFMGGTAGFSPSVAGTGSQLTCVVRTAGSGPSDPNYRTLINFPLGCSLLGPTSQLGLTMSASGLDTVLTLSNSGGLNGQATVQLGASASLGYASHTASDGNQKGFDPATRRWISRVPAGGSVSLRVRWTATDLDATASVNASITANDVPSLVFNPGSASAQVLPCTVRVGNNLDAGAGSLRQALADSPAGCRVDLAAINTQTVVLASPLRLERSVRVVNSATSPQEVILSGGGFGVTTRLMEVAAGATVNLNRLTFTLGYHVERGGALYNEGQTIISNSTFLLNRAGATGLNDASRSTAQNGFGGAIFNQGGLRVQDSVFEKNTAIGGNRDINGGNGVGGAIYNDGPAGLALVRTRFTDNQAVGGNGRELLADPSNGGGAIGGALYNRAQQTGGLSLEDTSFDNNRAICGNFNRNGGPGFAIGGAGFTDVGSAPVIKSGTITFLNNRLVVQGLCGTSTPDSNF